MATVTRESIGTLHDKITVKIAKEDYWPSFEQSLKKHAKSANVPGFRKGMVPAGIIRKMYGNAIFGDEVIRTGVRELEKYMQQEKLSIFAQPLRASAEEPLQMDMNAPGEFDLSFEIGLRPEVDIVPLKSSITLHRYKVAVSDKIVADEIDRTRRRYGKTEDQEAVTSDDDIVYVTYEASDEAGNVPAETISIKEDTEQLSKLPAKLKELLMGKKKDDTLVFRPADIAEGEELAAFLKDSLKLDAEAATQYFRLTLTKVSQLIPAALDETFFQQVFPNEAIADEAAFEEQIRKALSKEFDRVSRERLHDEIHELLVHQTPLELPVDFLKRWMKEGEEKPKTDEEIEKEFPSFDHQLRWTLISDKLIQDNNITVDREEIMQDVRSRVLAYFGMEPGDNEEMPWMDGYMQKVIKDNKMMDETYRKLLFEKLFTWLEGQFATEEREINEEAFFALPNPHAAHHH